MQEKDLVIIGGGPAGLTAAIYADRAAVDAVTIEQGNFGGQLSQTDLVDNYPGIENVSGFELAQKMHQHAEDLGAEFAFDVVEKLERDKDGERFIVSAMGETYRAKTVILATGATPRPAGFVNESLFAGHGVSYCATCDGMFYRDKTCFVVGGGNTACEEADFLTRFASEVIMVVRKDHMRAQAQLIKKVEDNPKVTIRYETAIDALEGEDLPSKVVFRNTKTGETWAEEYEPGSFGVFVFIGTIPTSELAKGLCECTDAGEIVTNERMETSTRGLYAAGDVRKKPLRQIVTACADGAQAATSAALYLGNMVI